MTCRVDPLPRFGTERRRASGKRKEKEPDDDQPEEQEETRFAPARAFHADPDRAIIALSSGLVPVRAGVFAGVVYLDEGSLAWEEGGGDGESSEAGTGTKDMSAGTGGQPGALLRVLVHSSNLTESCPSDSSSFPVTQPSSAQLNPAPGNPAPPLTTLVPWIDLHMPPSSLPTPAEPPLMSVFDHSSASSGHAPIQIQIHDALLGEEIGGGAAAAYVGGHHLGHGHGHHAGVGAGHAPAPAPPPPEVQLTGPGAPVPAPFMGALPLLHVAEEEPAVDDMERLYFNLFVHCNALRRFAESEECGGSSAPSISSTPSTPTLAPSTSKRASPTPGPARTRPHRPQVYEWDDWAPPIARLLTRMPMPAWACISHGQRFATLGTAGAGASTAEGEGGNTVDGVDENDTGGAGENGAGGAGANGLGGPNNNVIGVTGANVPAAANVDQPANPLLPDPNWLIDGGPGGANVKRPVRVLDFNPYGVRRGRGKEVQGPNKATVVDHPTWLEAGKYWEKPVKSALPYREVVTQEELLLSGVMIDGERVLGMRVSQILFVFPLQQLIAPSLERREGECFRDARYASLSLVHSSGSVYSFFFF
jgi:hypothetical protein